MYIHYIFKHTTLQISRNNAENFGTKSSLITAMEDYGMASVNRLHS
jgi:hypothetical protein